MTDRPLPHHALPTPALAAACLLFAWFALPARAQSQETPPADLVRAAIQNQLNDDAHLNLFAWKERKYRGRNTEVSHLVETPSGIVSRVMLINDQPLNPAQQSEEDERVRKMLEPAQMRRNQKERQEDDARTRKVLAAIPDAFDFVYLDTIASPNGHKLTRFRFTPRRGFSPPSRETLVFTGMQGEVLLDETAMRLAKIDGTLFKDVSFGWGILGRLYKGGRFLVEQREITPAHWDTTRMLLHFDGKALFFKSIHIDDNETSWDFQPVPPMSVEQALDYLTRPDPPQDAKFRR
jgi:hypothetical protein